jgi:hypothetical protein
MVRCPRSFPNHHSVLLTLLLRAVQASRTKNISFGIQYKNGQSSAFFSRVIELDFHTHVISSRGCAI